MKAEAEVLGQNTGTIGFPTHILISSPNLCLDNATRNGEPNHSSTCTPSETRKLSVYPSNSIEIAIECLVSLGVPLSSYSENNSLQLHTLECDI